MNLVKTITIFSLIGSGLGLSLSGCAKKEVPQQYMVQGTLSQKAPCESSYLFTGRLDKLSLEQKKQILIVNGEDPNVYSDTSCITSRAEWLHGTDQMSLNVQAAALRLTSDDIHGSKTDSLEYEKDILNYNSRVDAFNKKYGFLFQDSTK